jgi:hypothetical protein
MCVRREEEGNISFGSCLFVQARGLLNPAYLQLLYMSLRCGFSFYPVYKATTQISMCVPISSSKDLTPHHKDEAPRSFLSLSPISLKISPNLNCHAAIKSGSSVDASALTVNPSPLSVPQTPIKNSPSRARTAASMSLKSATKSPLPSFPLRGVRTSYIPGPINASRLPTLLTPQVCIVAFGRIG